MSTTLKAVVLWRGLGAFLMKLKICLFKLSAILISMFFWSQNEKRSCIFPKSVQTLYEM